MVKAYRKKVLKGWRKHMTNLLGVGTLGADWALATNSTLTNLDHCGTNSRHIRGSSGVGRTQHLVLTINVRTAVGARITR